MGQKNCWSYCENKDEKDFDLMKVIFSSEDKYRRKGASLKKHTSIKEEKLAMDQMQMMLSRPNSLKSSNSSSLRKNLKRLFSEDTEVSEDVGVILRDSKAKTKEYLNYFINDKWKLVQDKFGIQLYTQTTENNTEIFFKRSMIVDGTSAFILAILQDLEDLEETSEYVEKCEEKQDFWNGSRIIHRVDKQLGSLLKRDFYMCNTVKKLVSGEVLITIHTIKNESNRMKDAERWNIEGITRIKPITERNSLISEVVKIDMKQPITEEDSLILYEVYFNEFLKIKNSLSTE